MGLMDILKGIDIEDIAMGLAVASHGDTAVPNVLNLLEKRRIEQEAKNKQQQSSRMLDELYSNPALYSDPSVGIARKRREVNAMPDTINQIDVARIPQEDPVLGFPPYPIPTVDVANPAKAKAQADFILDAANAREQLPNLADAIGKLNAKYPDVDSDVKVKVFSGLYGHRASIVEKLMKIEADELARQDATNLRAEERKHKITTGIRSGEPYLVGEDLRTAPGTRKPDFAPSSITLYGPNGATKQVFLPKEGEYKPPSGWSIAKPEKPEKQDRLKPTDVKASYGMDMDDWKQKWGMRMLPEDNLTLSGSTSAGAVALLLSGKVGKSLSAPDKVQALSELAEIRKEHRGMMNDVLGRKGVKNLPTSQEPSKVSGKKMGDLWNEVKGFGDSGPAVDYLKKTYGYNDQQAKDIIRQGMTSGVLK